MAKQQIFERKAPEQDFLAKLEELLKKNRGSGLYEAYDVNPRAFRIGGQVVDPSGLGQDQMKDPIKFAPYDYSTIPMTAPNVGSVGQFEFTDFPQEEYIQRANPASFYNDPRYQEALSKPVETTQADKDQIFQETGKAYAIQQLKDGGILYIDGLIRYNDGTVRDYTGQEAEAIASLEDGSTRYSDGSVRGKATPQEFDVQSDDPAYPIASQADGTVMYSDGIARAFDPQAGEFKKADSGVINFFNTFDQGYRFQPRGANDLTGQCAWFSQQITTLPDGSDWRIGNTLEQKQGYLQNYMAGGMAFRPGEEDAKTGQSIVFDEGTRYGHVATISEIFRGADGQVYYRLTESNYSAPNTVTHDRVVRADDPKILGIIKTVPRQGYTKVSWEEAPQVTGERALQVQENASQTGEQERQEDTPEDKQIQEAPLMSQEVQPQQEQGYQPSKLYEAVKPAFDAIEPMSPQRQALAQVPEQLAQKTGLQAEFGLSEGISGEQDPMQARISALSQQPKDYNPYRQLLGNVTERIGDTLGIPEGAFSETLAGGATKRTNLAMADEIGGERPEAVPGIRQNIKDIGSDLASRATQAINPIVARAGEGIEALKDKASNLFQKTPLMGLFQGQKQVGDVTPGTTMIETTGQRGGTPTPDAFFRYGGADQYGQYLIDNAEQAKGGALSTSLFKPEFYQDPNRVANVFGETSQGAEATGKYKEYLGSQIKPGFNQPYRTEQRKEGDTLYEYKIPIQEYFQNQYYQNLLAETPETLKSGFSWDQFQMPTVSRSASEYKGEVPTKTGREPIFKSGVVDLFKRTGTTVGKLAGDIFKTPAPVYQPSQQSQKFEVPETLSRIFQSPTASFALPQVQKTAISKPTLSDYLKRGKTAAQYFAETGQQSVADSYGGAEKAAAQIKNIAPYTGMSTNQVANQILTGAYKAGVKPKAVTSGQYQNMSPANANMTSAYTGQPAYQAPVVSKPQSTQSTSKDNWLQQLFKRIF